MPRWPSNLTPGLKLNLKNSAWKYKKVKLSQLIFHRGPNEKFPEYLLRSFPLIIMFKKYRKLINHVLTLAKSKAQGKHLNILIWWTTAKDKSPTFPVKIQCYSAFGGLIPKREGSVSYFPVWCDSKFYGRRGLFINIWVERGMNNIWEC